ncbi:uncharacterized protein LOC108324668 [Vigna angularis]|uniref:uncharacterized protein LOC108324668 n=1 Tax=Phaseolus angularis TaxID=3914 RepID=UPI00080A361C|nr:uncharacterized protein LOC108324668 [Vigna angularis]
MEENFQVVIHHSGKFIKEGKLNYEGESTTLSFDPDMWNYFLVVSVVKGLGYDGFKELWYCVGGGSVLENRLEPLLDDIGAMHMITLARLNGEVHLFVVHTVSEPEVIHMFEYVSQNTAKVETVQAECEQDTGGECQQDGETQCKVPANEGERVQCDGMSETVIVSEERCEGHHVVEGEIECEGDVNEDVNDDVNDDFNDDAGDVRSWSSSGEDVNHDDGNDCMEGLVDVHVDFDIEEEVGDGVGNVQVDVQSDGASWIQMSDSDVDDGINSDDDRGLSDDEWESEELDSGAESDGKDDEDEGYGKFKTFSMPKTMLDHKWDLGTYFADKQDFVDAIKTYWSRLRFSSTPQCDTLVNNMSEAFNSVLVHTRSKPIISMLEEIRLYLMKRWATNRSKIQSLSGDICPKIKTRLNKESQLTKHWILWKWAITGVPCCHSLAVMKFLNLDVEDFIPCCFRKSTYEEIYSSTVYPINGYKMWEITTHVDVLPPPKRILPERPKKKRKLEQWELVKDDKRMRKGGIKKRCGICKQLGHNRTSCTKSTQTPDVNSHQTQETNPSTQPMMPSSNQDEVVGQGDI